MSTDDLLEINTDSSRRPRQAKIAFFAAVDRITGKYQRRVIYIGRASQLPQPRAPRLHCTPENAIISRAYRSRRRRLHAARLPLLVLSVGRFTAADRLLLVETIAWFHSNDPFALRPHLSGWKRPLKWRRRRLAPLRTAAETEMNEPRRRLINFPDRDCRTLLRFRASNRCRATGAWRRCQPRAWCGLQRRRLTIVRRTGAAVELDCRL